MNSEQIEVNRAVAQAFEDLGIAYYLCGSMASSYHGIYRSTADADFVANMRTEHVKPFVERLRTAFYVDEESVREAVLNRSSFNLIHDTTVLKVDIFVMKPQSFAIAQMGRRSRIEGSETVAPIYIATAEDTILAKLDWYRMGGCSSDRQWNDILGIMKTQREMLDRAYLEEWARETGVADLLRRALDDAGLAL